MQTNRGNKKEIRRNFAFYTIDYLIDPQNFEYPGQPVGKDYFTPISVGMLRTTLRFITSAIMNSDNGFLFERSENYKYPAFENDKKERRIFSFHNERKLSNFTDSLPDDHKIQRNTLNTQTIPKPANMKSNLQQSKDNFMKYMLKIKKKPLEIKIL